MQRVYVSDNLPLARQLAEVLRTSHVDCIIKNEFLSGAVGDLPPNECWPEIWAVNDYQADKARALVEAYLDAGRAATQGPPWSCRCGEDNEAQFSSCWRCGYERLPFETSHESEGERGR